jgi:energy-coupling factor transporter ATP-binding protein EcfA2
MELRRLRLDGFKGFRSAEIEPSRLTVLIGRNNAGKSTILQSLALLAQSAENPRGQLLTQGPRIDLGTDPLALAYVRGQEQFGGWKIEVDWQYARFPKSVDSPQLVDIHHESMTHAPLPPWNNTYSAKNEVIVESPPGRKVKLAAEWPSQRNTLSMSGNEHRFDSQVVPQISAEVQLSQVSPWMALPSINFTSEVVPSQLLSGDPTTIQTDTLSVAAPILQEGIKTWLSSFRYVGGDRDVEASVFDLADTGTSNPRSDADVVNTLAYLHAVRNRVSESCRRIFGYGVDVDLTPGKRVSLIANRDGQLLNVVNLGTGFVQLVWIVLHLELALLNPSTLAPRQLSIVGVEEPELHLHPALQPEMAGVFVDFIQYSGRQVLCTTQNEHFLMALLQMVLDGKLKPEFLSVYYVEDGAVQRLAVDDKGRLAGGFKGFFEANRDELKRRLDGLLAGADD